MYKSFKLKLAAFATHSPAHTHRRPAVYSSDPSDRRTRRTPGRAQGLWGSCRSWCRISCGNTGRWYCNCLAGAGGEGRPTADPDLIETEEIQENHSQSKFPFTISQSNLIKNVKYLIFVHLPLEDVAVSACSKCSNVTNVSVFNVHFSRDQTTNLVFHSPY